MLFPAVARDINIDIDMGSLALAVNGIGMGMDKGIELNWRQEYQPALQ
jgi:hypothetical protein